jgi:hypothetical protein
MIIEVVSESGHVGAIASGFHVVYIRGVGEGGGGGGWIESCG